MASPSKPATVTSSHHPSLRKCRYRSSTEPVPPCSRYDTQKPPVTCAVLNVKLTAAYSNRNPAGKHLQQLDQRITQSIVKNGPTKERLTKLAQAMGVYKACINAQKGTVCLLFVDLDALDWFWAEHDHDRVATVLTDILVNEGVSERGREITVRAAVDPAEFRTARRLLAGTEILAGASSNWSTQRHVTKCLNLEAGTKRALQDSDLCERLIQMTQHAAEHSSSSA
ncbi:PREDICTED: uncharacterized protein LOC109486339 [Branchiostoma belcheri]|uniref:Uncharacterized protein LOC109486339 n=1 Tax=Branchiostoma belcheri TaxID=7741 RepID=A0A6P5A7Z8_BRABE|nr:PREDICTED: uncharacterized protein LOC109486339 [Branchiostoma belcheri]